MRVLHSQYLEKILKSLGFPLLLSLFLFLLFVVGLCVCLCSAASTDLVEKSQAAQKLLKVVIAGLSEDAHSEEVRKVCVPVFFLFLNFLFIVFLLFLFFSLFFFLFFFSISSFSLVCHESPSVAVSSTISPLLICCYPAYMPFGFVMEFLC